MSNKGIEKFVNGMFFNAPKSEKPDFVLASIKIDLRAFSEFVKECRSEDWVKADNAGNECLFFDLTRKQNPADGFTAKMWKKSEDQQEQPAPKNNGWGL